MTQNLLITEINSVTYNWTAKNVFTPQENVITA